VLAAALLAGACLFFYPRIGAAWRLHGAATALADYGLCMVGPTGPSLLRDNPSEFRALVRRRLIAAAPQERVFQTCAPLARELTASDEVETAHRTPAIEFAEYGGAPKAAQGPAGTRTLESLAVDTHLLADLTQRGWPFTRKGYVRLIQASVGAREAIHPVELPRPAVGQGLPIWRVLYRSVRRTERGFIVALGKGNALSAYRSDDGGVNWKPASVRHPVVVDMAERCGSAPDSHFTFGVGDEGRSIVARSHDVGAALHEVAIAPRSSRVLAAGCDADTLVAALQPEGQTTVGLTLCRLRGACAELPMPRLRELPASAVAELDLARADGVTVVAVPMNGMVRVTSSRDDGKSWTPWSVAFDQHAHPQLFTHVPLPSRLLALGKRLMLFGGAPKPGMTYPVLVSDDYGASWRAPSPR
jgi:hypothetical protein